MIAIFDFGSCEILPSHKIIDDKVDDSNPTHVVAVIFFIRLSAYAATKREECISKE